MAKTALVTGANRGIGLEISRQLLAKGWTVWLSVRSEEKGAETPVWLATDAPASESGKFWRDKKEIAW